MAKSGLAAGKYRQTLLSFTTCNELASPDQTNSPLTTEYQHEHAGKPPPDLPAEVWNQIFRQLRTFALKKFRLVCRDWASHAEQRLYETLYLNIYESSWVGLLAVCNSRHAPYVRRLVWNPVAIPHGIMDATTWQAQFSDLLRGLKQYQLLSLYESFLRASRAKALRTTSLGMVAEVLGNLRNCHEAVLEDRSDFRESFQDTYVVKGIHENLGILQRPSNWAIQPPSWTSYPPKHPGIHLEGAVDVLSVLPACKSIFILQMDLWYHRWGSLWDNRISKTIKRQRIRNIRLHIRHFGDPSEWADHMQLVWLPPALADSFEWMCYFPQLREMHYSPIFCDPGDDFFSYMLLRAEPPDTGDGGHNFEEEHASETSRRDDIHDEIARKRERLQIPDLPPGMTTSMYRSLAVVVQLGYETSPHLETITFSDCLISMKALLCWLCCQPQVPTSGIHLRFRGTTILSQYDDTNFFEILSTLNVTIEYNHQQTFFYLHGVTGVSNVHRRGLPFMVLGGPSGDGYCVEPSSWDELYDNILSVEEPPQQMGPCPILQNRKPNQSEIARRPNNLLLSKLPRSRIVAEYYIIQSASSADCTDRWGYVFHQSLSGSPPSRPRVSKDVTGVIPLCRVSFPRPRDDCPYGYYYDIDGFHPEDLKIAENCGIHAEGEEKALLTADNRRRERIARELRDQALLQAYECHLLGLDVLITGKRLSQREADNVCCLSPAPYGGSMIMVLYEG